MKKRIIIFVGAKVGGGLKKKIYNEFFPNMNILSKYYFKII